MPLTVDEMARKVATGEAYLETHYDPQVLGWYVRGRNGEVLGVVAHPTLVVWYKLIDYHTPPREAQPPTDKET